MLVTNVGTDIVQSKAFDAQGRYRVSELLVGNYAVQASQAGFQTVQGQHTYGRQRSGPRFCATRWTGPTGSGATGSSLGLEAITEFQTLTNTYSAQFGGNGAVVNAVSRSGTNSFHESAYEFLRSSALDARSPFGTYTERVIRPRAGSPPSSGQRTKSDLVLS